MRLLCRTRGVITELLLTGVAPAVLVAGQLSQSSPLAGRWVASDSQLPPAMQVLYFQPRGTVLALMPLPQFGATYRLEGKRLQLTSTAGPLGPDRTPLVLMLDGNVLRKDGQALLRRLDGESPIGAGVGGTWRRMGQHSMEEFWTFRSDGEVIVEVGDAGTTTSTGDGLNLSGRSYRLIRDGDTLYVERHGKTGRYVRRPWGCFGLPDEANASECRQR